MKSTKEDSIQNDQVSEPDTFWRRSYTGLKTARRVVGGMAVASVLVLILEPPAELTGTFLLLCWGSFLIALVGLQWAAYLHRAALGYATRVRWWVVPHWQNNEKKLGLWAVRFSMAFICLAGYGIVLLLLGMRW